MKASEAIAKVKQYLQDQADAELRDTLVQINICAVNGKKTYFTYFDYDQNIERMRQLGYTLAERSRKPNAAGTDYDVYYDITWETE